MDNSNNRIIPYRIKQARISRGYSMAELAELIDVTRQAISQYELGKNEPSSSTLNLMIAVLKYPREFFTKPMPEIKSANSAIFFRKRKTTSVKAKNAAKEKIKIFREITNYLKNYITFPEPNFPKVDYDSDIEPLDNDTIEEYALSLRQHWGLGISPIKNLMNCIQKNGVMVSKMMLSNKKIDAFSVHYDGTPYIFLSSDKNTNVRTRFDIAHELGHLLLHSDFFMEEDINKNIINDKLEDEADRFAGAFLLPRESFSQDIYSSSLDHFIQLKSKWKVSIACMICRCETLGLLSTNQIKYLKDQMTIRRYWRKEPLDNTMPVEQPFAHKQGIELLLDNNILTSDQIIYDIGCNPEEIENYCFLDEGTLVYSGPSNVIQLKTRLNI